MTNFAIKKLTLCNFGPFEGEHTIDFPSNGLYLVKGNVEETSDGSGSGKSYLLKAIPFLFGGCPDPATEIQSWFTDEPPEVKIELDTPKGTVTVSRKKGLTISGDQYREPIKGNAAKAELTNLFGMDEETRAICTYRGQRARGLFLSLGDERKKLFLSGLLGLDKYAGIAETANSKASKLEQELLAKRSTIEFSSSELRKSEVDLLATEKDLELVPIVTEEQILSVREAANNYKKLVTQCRIEIDSVRQDRTALSEAVLSKYRANVKETASRSKPVEIVAIENMVDVHRKQLDKIREQDNLAKASVEKQRNVLRLEISTKKAAASNLKRLTGELQNLRTREASLKGQICSECKREWRGQDQENVLQRVVSDIEKVTEAIAVANEVTNEMSRLETKLGLLKDPGLDPEGAQIQEKIIALTKQAKEISEAFEIQKKSDINKIETEESRVRREFSDDLALSLQELKKREANAQNALECAISDEQKLSALLAQRKSKQALAERARSQATSKADSLGALRESAKVLETNLNLERDIAALAGKQGFLGTIFEEVLLEIAAVANDTLAKVANVRHLSLDFETEKEAKNGNISNRITPVIYNRGRKVSFSSGISGGMQTAVELAVDLAVGEVVTRRRGLYPSWLILDESFDGLGGTAKESCLEMLQQIATQKLVLVVDHDATFQGLFGNIIQVEQLDGRSRIVV